MAADLVRDMLEDFRTPLYRNAILLIFNTALVAGAGFVFWFIIAQLQPEAAVGKALVLLGMATFLSTLSGLGFGAGLIRFLPKAKEDAARLVNSCLTISTIVGVSLAVLMLLSIDLWFPEGRSLLRFWSLIPIFLLLVPMAVNLPIVDNTFVASRKAHYVLMRTGVFQSLRLVSPFLLVGILGVIGVLASLVVAYAAALSVCFFILLPRVLRGFRPGPAISKTAINDILHFSLGNHVADVLYALPYPALLLIVSRLSGTADEAAFFGIPWLIASLLFAVPLMTSVSLFAEGSHFEERLYHDLMRTLRFVVPLLVLGILSIWFLAGWILSFFGPSYAAEGTTLLRILGLSSVFVAVNSIFVSVARVKKWVRAIIITMAYIVLSTLTMAVFLVPTMGLEGTGIAWTVANATAAAGVVTLFYLRRRVTRGTVPAESPA